MCLLTFSPKSEPLLIQKSPHPYSESVFLRQVGAVCLLSVTCSVSTLCYVMSVLFALLLLSDMQLFSLLLSAQGLTPLRQTAQFFFFFFFFLKAEQNNKTHCTYCAPKKRERSKQSFIHSNYKSFCSAGLG